MRFIKITTLTLITVLFMSVSAFAGMWGGSSLTSGFPTSLDNFTSQKGLNHYLSRSSSLDGLWDVSFIYKEASHTNTWTTLTGESLSNQGTYGDSVLGVQLLGSVFSDLTDNQSFGIGTKAVKLYTVKNAFMVGGVNFLAGDLLIAFNDNWGGDWDYDDFVLKATKAATPIPGAAWLLGSGLIGLVGLRRRMRA